MSSNLTDSRVLQSFLTGIARQYMISVEQRLTGLERAPVASSDAFLNHAYVSKTTSFTTTSNTAVDVTGLSVTITTTGGNLLCLLNGQDFYVSNSGGATGQAAIDVDGTTKWVWLHGAVASYQDTYGLVGIHLFQVAAGTHTVKAVGKTNGGTLYFSASSTAPLFLAAIEI